MTTITTKREAIYAAQAAIEGVPNFVPGTFEVKAVDASKFLGGYLVQGNLTTDDGPDWLDAGYIARTFTAFVSDTGFVRIIAVSDPTDNPFAGL